MDCSFNDLHMKPPHSLVLTSAGKERKKNEDGRKHVRGGVGGVGGGGGTVAGRAQQLHSL